MRADELAESTHAISVLAQDEGERLGAGDDMGDVLIVFGDFLERCAQALADGDADRLARLLRDTPDDESGA